MARPRKPTALLELSGAFKKDPKRGKLRKNEPKNCGILSDPPKYFDKNHRKIWFELVEQAPKGVLTAADHTLLEIMTRLKCKQRYLPGAVSPLLQFVIGLARESGADPAAVNAIARDLRRMLFASAGEVALLATLLGRAGMTPADRSRVSAIEVQDEDNEWARFEALAKGKSARRTN